MLELICRFFSKNYSESEIFVEAIKYVFGTFFLISLLAFVVWIGFIEKKIEKHRILCVLSYALHYSILVAFGCSILKHLIFAPILSKTKGYDCILSYFNSYRFSQILYEPEF